MYTNQQHLAEAIVSTLRDEGVFEEVGLIGSVSEGKYDEMSDIDLVVIGHNRPPWENVRLASQMLRNKYGCLLHDWAGSLIPEKYLISYFLPGYDIMWWIDIGCYPDDNYSDISRDDISEEWNTHIGKLLVMNAKHYLRGTRERMRIHDLYEKVIGCAAKDNDWANMFLSVREHIDTSELSDEFVCKLDAVIKRVATKAHRGRSKKLQIKKWANQNMEPTWTTPVGSGKL